MKVPPKRKGNSHADTRLPSQRAPLNESPSEKEGKWLRGKPTAHARHPSMKVPPKRKGNGKSFVLSARLLWPLNESPSEKEGKFALWAIAAITIFAPQ